MGDFIKIKQFFKSSSVMLLDIPLKNKTFSFFQSTENHRIFPSFFRTQ